LIVPYLDTSALAKWYLHEPGSEEFEAFVRRFPRALISRLNVLELRCLLARRERAGDISEQTAEGAFRLFESDVAQGHLEVCPLDDRHAVKAIALLGQLRGHPLRTLDALHLAIAQIIGSSLLATADHVMARAGGDLGFEVVTFG
jgi:predicted nucleic acid-binding protein